MTEKVFRRLENYSGEVTTSDGKTLDAKGFLEAPPNEFFLSTEQEGVNLKFKVNVSMTAKGARLRLAQTATSLAREMALKLQGTQANRGWIKKMKNALSSVLGIPNAWAAKDVSFLTGFTMSATGVLSVLTVVALNVQASAWRTGLAVNSPRLLIGATFVGLLASCVFLTWDFVKD